MIAWQIYKRLKKRREARQASQYRATLHGEAEAPSATAAPARERVTTPRLGGQAVIEASGLVKRYGSLTAVNDVSFSVAAGEIFGLLGPNGAGKTTTLEMLEGLRLPDAGEAIVLGDSVVRHPRRIKERIGVQLQTTALPPKTTVAEAIDLFGAFYQRRQPTDRLLQDFDLTEKASAMTESLSGGQVQRLSLALALVNDPDLVFLDEPTTGLDPQARLNLWDVIEGIRARGKTVVITTHYMEEAQRLCDRVAIIDRGQIVSMDAPERLIAAHSPGTTIEFDTAQPSEDALGSIPGIDQVEVTGEHVTLHTATPEQVLARLFEPNASWTESVLAMRDLRMRQGTLEDVFIALTGRTLRS